MLRKGKHRPGDPFFAFSNRHLQKGIKDMVCKLGFNPDSFSSHSLRRGDTLWTFICGVPESLTKVMGDWSSDAYKRYLQYPLEIRAVVALKMRDFM